MTENNHTDTGQVDDDKLFFAEEIPETKDTPKKAPWKIMIVDDEKGIHDTTMRVLEGISFEGRTFKYLNAYSGKDAMRLIRLNPDTALILLDVVMETDLEGLKVVHFIRKRMNNHFVRIILRTGQPGQAPEREVITAYDINDYKLKSMLSDQGLYTAVISALRNYRDLDRIERSLEEAKIAEKAKYQFLANVSHELRTPLNIIIGSAAHLSDSELSTDQKESIHAISDAGYALLSVLSNVLDITSMTEGRLTLKEYRFSLRKTIQEVMKTILLQAGWKKIDAVHEIEEDVPDSLIGDTRLLKQALMNMMVNAIKHTEEGGYIALRISLFQEGPDQKILFSLSDSGVGIPLELQEKIFEAFTLGENVTTKRFAGMGLGLAISKSIVEKMDGSIWVVSAPGKGSTFYFTIGLKT